jgi:protocatechuate 3,4-dioxygenase beta subunit
MMALRSVVCLLALLGVSAASQLRVVGPDGRPAAGADVRVVVPPQGKLAAFLPFKADGTSDEEGGVDLRVPLVSGALIVVDHPGFAPASVAVGVKTSVTEIRLAAGPHWAGQVQVAGDAKVPSGGRACISGTLGRGDPAGERRWRRCAAVGAKGEFAIAGLGPPPWKLSVTVPGFLAESAVVSAGRSHPQRLRPGVTLQGSVSDEQGSPLAGVVVRAGPEETASGEDGTFDLAVSRLPATLTFTKESFLDGQAEVADTQRPLTVRLASAPTVTATLLTPEGPYSGKLAVWYRSETGPGEPDALASRDATVTKGALAVPLPGPGAYSFVLRPEGYQEVRTGTVPVGPDQRLSLGTLVLAQGCGVTGEVTDEATGAAVPNVLIDAIPVGSTVFFLALARGMPAAVSDRKGRFAVGGLRPGRYLLRLQRADLAPAYRVVSVASLMDLGRLTVGAGIVLGGRVTGVGGAPQDGVEVRVFDPAREAIEPLAGARTDADGQYRLPALGPGRYRIELWRGRLLNAQELTRLRLRPTRHGERAPSER